MKREAAKKATGEVPEGLLAKVEGASRDGKISCTVARRLAEEMGVPVRQVGEVADELGIKIYACELGCF